MNSEKNHLIFNSILNSMQSILYVYLSDTKEIEFLNSSTAKQVGLSSLDSNKITLENFLNKLHQQDRSKYLNQIEGILSGRERKEKPIEYRITRKNGDFFLYSDILSPVKSTDPNIKEIVGFASNITNVRRKEEIYQNEEIRLKAILENAREQYFFLGIDYKLQSLNKNAKDFLTKAYNRSIFEGYSILEFLPLENPNVFTEKFNYALNGTPIHYESQFKDENGIVSWYQFSYVPVRNKLNQITNICLIIIDISEIRRAAKDLMDLNRVLEDRVKERTQELLDEVAQRRNAEKRLQVSLDREKELNELKSKFIALVSHQFKTPMTTISMSTQMLETYGEKYGEQERQKHYKRIKQANNKLYQLIDGILSLSKSEASNMPFEPILIDIKKFMKQLVSEFQSDHPEHNFVLKFQKNLRADYSLDTNLISHILGNLLSNAVKYSPLKTNILLIVVLEDKYIEFIVRDKGLGIPEEDQKRIFETFYRGKNVSNISGTGLGLNIVKNLVELHSGKIHFNSSEANGTEFYVWIPNILG